MDARVDGGASDGKAGKPKKDDASATSDGATSCSTCVVEDVVEVTGAFPTHLVVDATDVYFSYHLGRHIHRAPKAGGGTATLVASEPNGSIFHLGSDASHLYLVLFGASEYRIDEIAKSGGAFRTLYQSGFASNIDVENFVVDGNVVYLAAGKNAGGTVDLLRIDVGSAAATPVNAAWSPGRWLAGNASDLFWASSGHLYRAPKSGSGTPQELAWPGTEMNPEVVADGSDVFYGFKHSVDLHKVSGTNDVALHADTPSASFVWGPIVDATHVYVLASDSNDTGTIYRVPRSGGTLEVFADQQEDARGLALDATHVYWAARAPAGSGSSAPHVVRKAK